MLALKPYMEDSFPLRRVIISILIDCTKNGKASSTVLGFSDLLATEELEIRDNRDFGSGGLTPDRLYLNGIGYGKLAVNYIKIIKISNKKMR